MQSQANGRLDLDFLKRIDDSDGDEKAFKQILGFKIQNELDRRLLIGCWADE